MRGRVTGLHCVSLVIGAVFAAPFVYLVVRNLAEGSEFFQILVAGDTLAALGRSLALAVSVSAACALLGGGAAWAVVRTDLPGRRVWRVLLALPLVVPSFIGAFALIAAFAPGGLVEDALGVTALPSVGGFAGAFTVLTFLSYPFVYLPVAARLAQLPRGLEESARLLGRRPAGVFFQVVLPQTRGALAAGSLLVFLYTLSDFGAVQLMRYDTLTREIYANRLLDAPTSLALSLQLGALAICVVVLERLLGRRQLIPDTRRGGRPLLVPLGHWRWPAGGLLGLLIGFALLAPVAVLAFWAIRGVIRGSTRASALVAHAGELAGPTGNTALVSVVAAACAVAVVLPVAYLAARRSRLAEATNAVVVGGFALPGLVVALALVFWTLSAPGPLGALYQTLPLLIIAYVIHFAAQSMRTAHVAVAGIPRHVNEAARSLGAGRLRRLGVIDLPLMTPALLAGGGLVLLSAMKELPATLLLAPAGFQTLATKIWVSTEDAFLADASLAALVLVALSAILTWLLVVRHSTAIQ